MLQFSMNWTPVTSIRTRAAHPSAIRARATSGVCGSRPGREDGESGDLCGSYGVGSYLVGEHSSPGSVRLFSRRKIPLSPFSSTFAHRFRKHRKDCGDTGVHSRMRKWAYSAQFWCNISPFRMNTCKSVSKQRTSTPFRMNTYEKTPGGGGILPILERPQTKRIRGSSANLRTLNACALSFSVSASPPSTFNCGLSTSFSPPLHYPLHLWQRCMPTREHASKLLCDTTASESLRKDMLAVEACVRAYARKTGADEETWGLAALLHDFDYERWPNQEHSPDQGHPSEGAKILREPG